MTINECTLNKNELDKLNKTHQECLEEVKSNPSLGREYVMVMMQNKDSKDNIADVEQMYENVTNKNTKN